MGSEANDSTTIKLCLCGMYGVGKTSIRRNYMGTTRFKRSYIPTIGSDFSFKENTIDGTKVRILIWDLAGESRFRQFRSLYFQGSHGAIVVFDLTSKESFEQMEEWIRDLQMYTNTKGVPFTIVGNKADLVISESEQAITDAEIMNYVQSLRNRFENQFSVNFIKTSALTGENIEESFIELVKEVIVWKESLQKVVDTQ